MLFEAIVANPPFSAHWSANPLFMSDDRFSQYGKLAPGSKADFAFVQHMIHHLAENGTMAIVLPHGALFRGCLLYTSDAADERSSVDLGGRRIIKKKKNITTIGLSSIKQQNNIQYRTALKHSEPSIVIHAK